MKKLATKSFIILLSMCGILSDPRAAKAAENITFFSGAFRRTIPVKNFEELAETGKATGLLEDLLRLGNQKPEKIADMLNQKVELPIVLTSRLTNSKIGEAIISRVAKIIHPIKIQDPAITIPAIRSGVIIGITYGEKEAITAIDFMKAYPNKTMAINLPELFKVVSKVESVSDLIKFFSDKPLEKL